MERGQRLTAARERHSAALLQDGRVLVAGGFNGKALASAEIYEPTTATWGTTGGLSKARYLHTTAILPDGRVMIVAGEDDTGEPLSSAELYTTGL